MTHLMDTALHSVLNHGSIILFFVLMLGIVGLPLPDETFLVIVGALMEKGKLSLAPTFIAAYLGSMTGITLSYLIGRTAGSYVVKKYGKWVGLNEKKIQKAHRWFIRIGKWALFIGYFIPGVRHLTGYVAGTLELNYKKFALLAYSGAIVWVSIFLTIGYFIGHQSL